MAIGQKAECILTLFNHQETRPSVFKADFFVGNHLKRFSLCVVVPGGSCWLVSQLPLDGLPAISDSCSNYMETGLVFGLCPSTTHCVIGLEEKGILLIVSGA